MPIFDGDYWWVSIFTIILPILSLMGGDTTRKYCMKAKTGIVKLMLKAGIVREKR